MLLPKKTKHRKAQKGRSRSRSVETRGLSLSYGKFGLKAMEMAYLSSRQLEAARRTVTGFIKREGKLWIRVFPDKPITQRPPEVTMGMGKGSVDHYAVVIRPGRIIFEMDGVTETTARRALQLCGYKLPCKTKFIQRGE